ncbi:MAG TPA: hypothetical protein DIT07_02745, partial [Sphingobacteriaceae bacterium]|nr:hypothetical protein [Sphingobacteriaceae bacterium]
GINYIIAGTEDGQFYFFDHGGNIIGKAIDGTKSHFKNPLAIDKSNSQDSKILTTDTAGTIKNIFFNGKMAEKSTGIWSEKHFFDAKNITGDINPEWIYLDKSQLYVYNSDNTLAYNYNFGAEIVNRPQYFLSNQSTYQIGIASSKDNLLYLFNEDGSFVKGFPIEGVPNFYVGNFMNNGFRYLICGDKSNYLYVYKL